MTETCGVAAVGRGEELAGELVAVAGEGVTEDGLDQPTVDDDVVGLAVNFAVTKRGCDEVGCMAGRADDIK